MNEVITYKVKGIKEIHVGGITYTDNSTGILTITNSSGVLYRMDHGVNFAITRLKYKPRIRDNKLTLFSRSQAHIFEILEEMKEGE